MRFTDIAGKKWEIRSHHEVADAPCRRRRGRDTLRRRLDVCAAMRCWLRRARVPNGDLLDAGAGPAWKSQRAGSGGGSTNTNALRRAAFFALGDVSSDYQLKHVCQPRGPRSCGTNLLQDWDDTDALMPSNHRYVPAAVFHRPADRQRRAHRKSGQGKRVFKIRVKIQDYSDVRLRMGDGGHHRHREGHRRRRYGADPRRATSWGRGPHR